MKRVLITGATGALGRAVVNYAKRLGTYQIFITSNCSVFNEKSIVNLRCDFRSLPQLSNAYEIAQPDLVLHLGGVSPENLTEAFLINVAPAAHLLELIKTKGSKTKIVLVGSAAEYGRVGPEENPIDEEHMLSPLSIYGLSKVWQTQLIELYASWGVDVVCARVFNLFGPGVSEKLFAGRIQNQIDAIKKGLKSTIEVGSLAAVRDYISTSDAAQLLYNIAEQGIAGHVYHIGSGEPISMRDFLIGQLQSNGLSPTLVHELEIHSNRSGYDVPVIFADMHKTRSLIAGTSYA